MTYHTLGEKAEDIREEWGQVEFDFDENTGDRDPPLETISVRIAPEDLERMDDYLDEFETPFSNRSEMIRDLITIAINIHRSVEDVGEIK